MRCWRRSRTRSSEAATWCSPGLASSACRTAARARVATPPPARRSRSRRPGPEVQRPAPPSRKRSTRTLEPGEASTRPRRRPRRQPDGELRGPARRASPSADSRSSCSDWIRTRALSGLTRSNLRGGGRCARPDPPSSGGERAVRIHCSLVIEAAGGAVRRRQAAARLLRAARSTGLGRARSRSSRWPATRVCS